MDADFHPARLRSAGIVLLDIAVAGLVLATLLVVILTLLSDNARDELARAYARQLRLADENACPAAFGKQFWFTCASEVRHLKAPLTPQPPVAR